MSEEKRVATAEILNTSVHVSVKLNNRYQGPPGPPGKDGTVRFEDLTEAQIEQLRGPQGLTGKTPQITVQVETGEPGTEASVVQSGTAEAPVIALTIPRGNVGATPQITVQVKTGEPGTAASVKQTGTAEAPVIELTIPRGDTGSLGNLTINGKAPDAAGKVKLTAADVGAASAGELSQLKTDVDAKANKSIVSDAWQSGKTYNTGAYCIYNDNLYKALVQTTAVPTNSNDWVVCTVADEIIAITPKNTEHKVLATDYGNIDFYRQGKVVSFYGRLDNLPTGTVVQLGITPFALNIANVLFPCYSSNEPYNPVGSIWIYKNSTIELYKPEAVSLIYVFGTSIFAD